MAKIYDNFVSQFNILYGMTHCVCIMLINNM